MERGSQCICSCRRRGSGNQILYYRAVLWNVTASVLAAEDAKEAAIDRVESWHGPSHPLTYERQQSEADQLAAAVEMASNEQLHEAAQQSVSVCVWACVCVCARESMCVCVCVYVCAEIGGVCMNNRERVGERQNGENSENKNNSKQTGSCLHAGKLM